MIESHRNSSLDEQTWTFDQYQFVDFFSNETIICPIRSQWIHFEEYLLTIFGLILTSIVTIRIHFVEIRFEDYFSIFRSHIISGCLIAFFLLSFLFNVWPSEKTCRYEQIFLQIIATILFVNLLLIAFSRRLSYYLKKCSNSTKIRWIFSFFLIAIIFQLFLTFFWLKRRFSSDYFRQTCFHRVQIHICLHDKEPLYFSSFLLSVVFLVSATNVYRFTRPFAVAELLESIISSIGLILCGSMWLTAIFFSNYPQMPFRYVSYVVLLTYMLPRIWISELERSRITVEEVKPLLHDQIQFHNGNCSIRFSHDENDDDFDDFNEKFSSTTQNNGKQSKKMIKTMEMSPGEIFSSIFDKNERNFT